MLPVAPESCRLDEAEAKRTSQTSGTVAAFSTKQLAGWAFKSPIYMIITKNEKTRESRGTLLVMVLTISMMVRCVSSTIKH
jgi:hypothetical protein